MTESMRFEEANKIVNSYVKWSAAAGVIPVPIWDATAVSGVQLKMLHALSKHYGLEFRPQLVRSLIGSLLGGVSSRFLAYGGIGSTIKSIPGVGTLFGLVAMPISSAATAYALGKVFIKHFEMGGTFLDFNPNSSREYFQKELEHTKAAPETDKKTK